jgi:hypothetical protein
VALELEYLIEMDCYVVPLFVELAQIFIADRYF